MADAYGNVMQAPGGSVKPYVNDLELLYSYAQLFQKGCTLQVGQGLLAIGTPLEVNPATGQYVVSPTSSTITKGFLRTAADTGVALLPAPSGVTATAVGSGGTFAAGTYFWVVTYLNGYGETTQSNEVTATIVANGSATITGWGTPPAGTTNVRIYRGVAAGQEYSLIANLAGTATTYTDTGSAGIAGRPPVSNSTQPGGIQTKLGNIVLSGVLRKDLVELANGGPLSSTQKTALGAPVIDPDFGFIRF